MRLESKLDKAAILSHIKDIVSKLKTVSSNMRNIFEYHQALGLLPLQELDQKSLSIRKERSMYPVQVCCFYVQYLKGPYLYALPQI